MSNAPVDFELALCTAIIEQKAMKDVLAQKVTQEHFASSTGKAAFLHLMKWYREPKYNDTPSWEMFNRTFPDFRPVHVDESINALCDELRKGLIVGDMAQLLQDIAMRAEEDPYDALALVQAASSRLTTRHIVEEGDSMEVLLPNLKENYFRQKANPNALLGLPYPWAPLNRALLGAQDGQLIFMYARPKQGKTTLAVHVVTPWIKLRKRGLICTQEMSVEEMTALIAVDFARANDSRVATGRLSLQDEADYIDNLDALAELPLPIITKLAGKGEAALSELTALIDQHRPAWVFIDGVYLLADNDWKVLADITRNLKRIITRKGKEIPLLGTTQANRPQGKTKVNDGADDFGGSDSFYQDCDVAIRVKSDPADKKERQARIWIAAARRIHVPSCAFILNFRPAYDFSVKEEIEMEAEEMQAPEDENEDIRVDTAAA